MKSVVLVWLLIYEKCCAWNLVKYLAVHAGSKSYDTYPLSAFLKRISCLSVKILTLFIFFNQKLTKVLVY